MVSLESLVVAISVVVASSGCLIASGVLLALHASLITISVALVRGLWNVSMDMASGLPCRISVVHFSQKTV